MAVNDEGLYCSDGVCYSSWWHSKVCVFPQVFCLVDCVFEERAGSDIGRGDNRRA